VTIKTCFREQSEPGGGKAIMIAIIIATVMAIQIRMRINGYFYV